MTNSKKLFHAATWLHFPVLMLFALYMTPTLASVVVGREFKSPTLQRDWPYVVYLPSGYDPATLRYPVLYLLHGNGGTRNDWVVFGGIQSTLDSLIASGRIPPTIVVMPEAGTTWYVDAKEKMETAILEDLIPDVERCFSTVTKRDGRLVAGLSMGGYGALRFALKFPGMFTAAALLSPAIYRGEPPENSTARRVGVFGESAFDSGMWKALNYPALWDAYLAKKQPVPMYINSGDDDELFIEMEAVELYALLRKHHQLAELRIVDGAHTWSVWESTVADALSYIFRFSTRPMMVEPMVKKQVCHGH